MTKKNLTVKSQRTYILPKQSKQQKCLAQKFCGELSQWKNIQDGKSYGNGCEIKKLTEKTDIKTSDGNNNNNNNNNNKRLFRKKTFAYIIYITKILYPKELH